MPITESELKQALIGSDAIFHNSHDGMVCIGADSRIIFVNAAAVTIFGYDNEQQLIGERIERLMNDQNAARHEAYVSKHMRGESIPVMNRLRRIRARAADGRLFPIDIHVFHIEAKGERCYVSFIRDMSEIVQKEQDLHKLAYFDPKTDLPNSRSLESFLNNLFDMEPMPECLIVVAGIDGMRTINASFGFDAGDEVIKTVAQRLRSEFGEALFFGRLFGDQFILVLEIGDRAPDALIADLRDRIDNLFMAPVAVSSTRVKVDITAGVIDIPDLAVTPELAVMHAEMAYGDAQKLTRKGICRLDRARLDALSFSASLTHKLQDAIQGNEFFIVIQPKIRLSDAAFSAGEVLVRWRQADGTMVRPDIFIPAAEDSGLISAIGRFVLLEACGFLHALGRGEGGLPKLAVNASPHQLMDEAFVDLVADALQALKVDPHLLEIEITETAVAESPAQVVETLSALRRLGLSVALDDFGTGHSSLTMLETLPIDRVKLDKSFIDRIEHSPKSFKLVENSARMMKDLGLAVTVEGVETRAVHDLLKAFGVDEAQGYYYSKPLEPAAFRDFRFKI